MFLGSVHKPNAAHIYGIPESLQQPDEVAT